MTDLDSQIKANQPDEILDWVNEQDEIIGEVNRKLANSDPKYIHREVGILLLDSQNRILWQKRSAYKAVNPNMWSITAGHVVQGQNPDQVAHQELKEELGFNVPLQFVKKELQYYPHETHFMYYYIGRYNQQVIQVEPAEVSETRFLNWQELQALEAEGQTVNHHHFPICQQLWQGELDLAEGNYEK